MWMVRRAGPAAASLGVTALVTAVLWYLRATAVDLPHPVFFYLLPVALLARFYGGGPALFGASLATACAAFFLYEPLYSFQVANRLEIGDLAWFAVLAVLGVKCTAELLRPSAISPAKPRYRRI